MSQQIRQLARQNLEPEAEEEKNDEHVVMSYNDQ